MIKISVEMPILVIYMAFVLVLKCFAYIYLYISHFILLYTNIVCYCINSECTIFIYLYMFFWIRTGSQNQNIKYTHRFDLNNFIKNLNFIYFFLRTCYVILRLYLPYEKQIYYILALLGSLDMFL